MSAPIPGLQSFRSSLNDHIIHLDEEDLRVRAGVARDEVAYSPCDSARSMLSVRGD